MTKLLWFRMAVTVVASIVLVAQIHAAEMKEVCRVEKVKGKDTKVCKTIKVHKKLDATKVPPK